MKKNFTLVSLLATTLILVTEVFSNKAGAPEGHTNSPFDNKTCSRSGCHTGPSPILIPGNVLTSDIPAEGYTPGSTYNFTLTYRRPGHTRYGFQISPHNASGTLIGTLINSTATAFSSGGTKYITHKSSSMDFSNGTANWSFQWTAPAAGTGTVNFYGAINASNNNQIATGDTIVYFSTSVQENTSVGLAKNTIDGREKFFVKNVSNGLEISLKSWVDFPFEISVYDLSGKRIAFEKIVNENAKSHHIKLTSANSPVVFVHLLNEKGEIYTQKAVLGVE